LPRVPDVLNRGKIMNSEKQSVTLLFWNRAQPDGQRVSIGVNRATH